MPARDAVMLTNRARILQLRPGRIGEGRRPRRESRRGPNVGKGKVLRRAVAAGYREPGENRAIGIPVASGGNSSEIQVLPRLFFKGGDHELQAAPQVIWHPS